MINAIEIDPLFKALKSLDSAIQFIISGQLLQITQAIGDVHMTAVSKAVADISLAIDKEAAIQQIVTQLQIAHAAYEIGWKRLDSNLGGIDWTTFEYNQRRDVQSLMLLALLYIALKESKLAQKTLETINETASKSSLDDEGFGAWIRILSHFVFSGLNWKTWIMPSKQENDEVLSLSNNDFKKYAVTFIERASSLIKEADRLIH